MEKQDVKILSEGIIEEIDDFITKAGKIKKVLITFIENIDILSEEYSDEQIALIFRNIDIKVTDINSLLSILLSDSKKLQSFLHEIKLLKRKREEKLGKIEDSKWGEILKALEELQKIQPQPTLIPLTPSPNTNPYIGTPYTPGTGTGTIWCNDNSTVYTTNNNITYTI